MSAALLNTRCLFLPWVNQFLVFFKNQGHYFCLFYFTALLHKCLCRQKEEWWEQVPVVEERGRTTSFGKQLLEELTSSLLLPPLNTVL